MSKTLLIFVDEFSILGWQPLRCLRNASIEVYLICHRELSLMAGYTYLSLLEKPIDTNTIFGLKPIHFYSLNFMGWVATTRERETHTGKQTIILIDVEHTNTHTHLFEMSSVTIKPTHNRYLTVRAFTQIIPISIFVFYC